MSSKDVGGPRGPQHRKRPGDPEKVSKPSSRRPGLADVARLAGVGVASVDRVLNERGHVSHDMARRVIEAAREVGLRRTLPPLYQRGLRIEVVLVRRESPFFARLNAAFRRIGETLDRSVIVQRSFVDEARPDDVAEHILASNCDAMILYGQEHPVIIDAVASVTSGGVPVVTLVSDLPTAPRVAYVGIDHYSAGRTAAFFMASMVRRPGSVIVICHSFDYRAHAERVSGFREGLAEYNPGLRIAAVLQGKDQRSRSEKMIHDQLRAAGGEIVGIYNSGAANRAIEAAIIAADLDTKPLFIGHELTVHTARMLADRVMTLAIDQNPEMQATRAIDVLLRRAGYSGGSEQPTEVPFTIHGPENLRTMPDHGENEDS